jgi:hypothetical protein
VKTLARTTLHACLLQLDDPLIVPILSPAMPPFVDASGRWSLIQAGNAGSVLVIGRPERFSATGERALVYDWLTCQPEPTSALLNNSGPYRSWLAHCICSSAERCSCTAARKWPSDGRRRSSGWSMNR